MDISIALPRYDSSVYREPWIARVEFEDGLESPRLHKGITDNAKGAALRLVLEAVTPGDVVAHGQAKHGEVQAPADYIYFILTDRGRLQPATFADAYSHYCHRRGQQRKKVIEEAKRQAQHAAAIASGVVELCPWPDHPGGFLAKTKRNDDLIATISAIVDAQDRAWGQYRICWYGGDQHGKVSFASDEANLRAMFGLDVSALEVRPVRWAAEPVAIEQVLVKAISQLSKHPDNVEELAYQLHAITAAAKTLARHYDFPITDGIVDAP